MVAMTASSSREVIERERERETESEDDEEEAQRESAVLKHGAAAVGNEIHGRMKTQVETAKALHGEEVRGLPWPSMTFHDLP